MPATFAWTVYGTSTVLTLAVIGLLGTALFRALGRLDTLSDRVHDVSAGVGRMSDRFDVRFDGVDVRFDKIEARQRTDKHEILERLDVLAERVSRLEGTA